MQADPETANRFLHHIGVADGELEIVPPGERFVLEVHFESRRSNRLPIHFYHKG